MVQALIWALALAGAAYASVLAALWWHQEALLFQPTPLPADAALPTGPDVHEQRVAVPGAELSVLELRLPRPRGVVFFLHGNAGNLQSWFVNLDLYRQAGFDLVMPDYRGYGRSTGRIESQAQLQADMAAVWRSVAPRYAGKRVVFFGRSLGTGLAAQLATEVQPDLTVLVSPYASLQALAAEQYPWVPGGLLRYPMRTDLVLPQLKRPVLLVHGEQDSLIRPAHSERLQQLQSAAQLVRVPGAGHNDLQDFPRYRQVLAQALAGLP